MSKKMILLGLAVASLAAFALPATAMAVEEDVPVHVVPTPVGVKTVDGEGNAVLTTSLGNSSCISTSGTAEFASSTTGTLQMTFGSSTTPKLDFHLVTAVDTVTGAKGPGVLVTPNGGSFGTFSCGLSSVPLEGNGLIGTIRTPQCGQESTEFTVEFSSSSQAVQTHKTVASNNLKTGVTPTEYSLSTSGGALSLDLSIVITLGSDAKLECT